MAGTTHRIILRCLLIVPYAAVVFEYLIHEPSESVFLGCFRNPEDVSGWALATNRTPLAFLVFGLMIVLEWPCTYLLPDDAMVSIRRRDVLGRLLRYGMCLAAYCLVFTGIPLALTVLVVGRSNVAGPLMSTAVCAAWQLCIAIAIRDIGALLGNRAIGYLAALAFCLVMESARPVESWLMADSHCLIPHWVFAYAVISVGLAVSFVPTCKRLEII